MNAIISKGDRTAHVQLPVGRKQLSGALSYLGANHTSDYDLKYNEENKDELKVSLECFGVVENAIAKALPVGLRFNTLNDALTLMDNLPYQNRREVENTIKVDGLESFEQFNKMLVDAYPQSVTTKYYCPLTIQVHSRDSYGDIDEDMAMRKMPPSQLGTRTSFVKRCWSITPVMKSTWQNTSTGITVFLKSYVLPNGILNEETASSTDASPF